MINISRILLVIILTFTSMNEIRAQWVQTNGPYGGMVTCLIMKDSSLFAGTYLGGVFRSTDDGKSWTSANNGLTNTGVTSLAFIGTSLYSGTGTGLFLSTNDGASWSAVHSGLRSVGLNSLAASGTTVLAGDSKDVSLSTNGGSSWTPVDKGLSYTYLICLAMSGSNLFAGTERGVFLSTDKGSSWKQALDASGELFGCKRDKYFCRGRGSNLSIYR